MDKRVLIIWTLIGTLSFAFSQFGILMIISNFGRIEDLGNYTLGLALSAPLMLFSNLQIGQLLIANYKGGGGFFLFKRTLFFSLSFGIIILSLFSLIYVIILSKKWYLLFVIIILGIIKSVDSMSDLYLAYSQKSLEIRRIGIVKLVRSLINFTSFVLIFHICENLILALVFQLLTSISRYHLFDKKKIKIMETEEKFDFISIKKLYLIGLPLGFVALINSLNANLNSYFLDIYTDISLVAVYNTLSYLFVLGNIIISPLTMYAAPVISKTIYYREKEIFIKKIKSFCLICMGIFTILFLLTNLIGPNIISLVFNEEISNYAYLLMPMSVALLLNFLTAIFNTAIIALKLIKIQPFVNMGITVIALLVGTYLVREFSILGSIYLIILISGIQTLVSFSILKYGYKKYNWDSPENNENYNLS